jgi:hypothetical protein
VSNLGASFGGFVKWYVFDVAENGKFDKISQNVWKNKEFMITRYFPRELTVLSVNPCAKT